MQCKHFLFQKRDIFALLRAFRIRAFLVFLLIFAFVYFLWSIMQYNEAMEKKEEKQEYVNKLKDDIQRLEYLVDAPLDDDFKIRIAREKLGMCFPDEIIFYGEYE